MKENNLAAKSYLESISLQPPYRIGIIGGGQLGKMMAIPAKQMGFQVIILDPTVNCPASGVVDEQIVANFNDCQAIRQLASKVEVLTYEFEHINSDCLIDLEQEGYKIHPAPKNLKLIQNKLTQKETLSREGILVPDFQAVFNLKDIQQAISLYGYPVILKSCHGGYDGKGNHLINKQEDISVAYDYFQGRELMVEKFVNYTCEVSVIVARDNQGIIKSYPVAENEHYHNILRKTIVPARISQEIANKAKSVAESVIEIFKGVGVFCVEMFVTKQGEVLVNEVAPRPHNSGHYTIEACETSQFEQHVRAITGLPLGDTSLRFPAVMINLLGEMGEDGPAVLRGCKEALSLPRVHLHFYGKKHTKPLRKMGHVTVTAPNLEEAEKIAETVQKHLRVVSDRGEKNE